MRPWDAALVVLVLALGSCSLGVNPNTGRFSCDRNVDCGHGFECRPQLNANRGLCYPVGFCHPEICNGLDDDCNGVADDTFDFASDPDNCGACGVVCPSGTQCQSGSCAESACADGLDNDGDGAIDCLDPDCHCDAG